MMQMLKELLKKIRDIIFRIFFKSIIETRDYQNPIRLKMMIIQFFTSNRKVPWPVHFTSVVTGYDNINIGVDVNPGYSPGCYIQGKGKITIGSFTQIAPNVGIISANHDIYDPSKHVIKSVKIGEYCWVGMNSVITPGVELGDHTIVAAGSVVTKSFEEGYCIIAGSPAVKIKDLVKEKTIKYDVCKKYIGYKKQ